MGKEVSLVPPYMIWAAALPQGHGPTSTCIACRAWSGLTIHTDKTFQESHQEIPFTTWKNNTECKPHKIGFENLRAFFLCPPCWAAILNILCICFVFILPCTAPHIFECRAICSAFTSFSAFTVWGVAFLGWLEVCSASVSKGLCSILIMACTWHRQGMQPVPSLEWCSCSLHHLKGKAREWNG